MKKIIFFFIFFIFCIFPAITQMATFDMSNWLTAIDTLYSQYDQINNTIMQIQQQYEQIQQAAEAARNINWDDVKLNGGIDIRDDIRSVTSSVNRKLNTIRKLQDTLTAQNMNFGGMQLSVADLCGLNGSDTNVFAAVNSQASSMSDTLKRSLDLMVENEKLSEKEKQAIWAKYGLSPRNYVWVQAQKSLIKTQISKAMAYVNEEAMKLQMEENAEQYNALLSQFTGRTDLGANEIMQTIGLLAGQLGKDVHSLTFSLQEASGLTAQWYALQQQEKEAEADSKGEREKLEQEATEALIRNTGTGFNL